MPELLSCPSPHQLSESLWCPVLVPQLHKSQMREFPVGKAIGDQVRGAEPGNVGSVHKDFSFYSVCSEAAAVDAQLQEMPFGMRLGILMLFGKLPSHFLKSILGLG